MSRFFAGCFAAEGLLASMADAAYGLLATVGCLVAALLVYRTREDGVS